MNKAKKLAKNNGIADKDVLKKGSHTSGSGGEMMTTKNKILMIVGICLVALLCGGVLFMQLRPRAILAVSEGNSKRATVYMKEAVYDIYQAETQYNQYSSLYQQMYGTTYWEMDDVDGKGRNGAQAAKKQVMDGIKQRTILNLQAEKENVTLTEDEKKTAATNAQEVMKNLSDKQKQISGLDENTIRENLEKGMIANKMREKYIADAGVDENAIKAKVSKDDYRQYDLQYYKISNLKDGGSSEQASVESPSTESGSAEKQVSAAKKKKNLEVMEKLKKKYDKTKDFEGLLSSSADAASGSAVSGAAVDSESSEPTVNKDGVMSIQTEKLVAKDIDSSSFLTKKLRKKLVKLSKGSVSEVIEGDDGYYLVYMQNDNNTEAYDEECNTQVETAKDDAFKNKYSELVQSYTFEVQDYWKDRVKLGNYTYNG